MKIGDYVQFKKSNITEGGVQKRGIILEFGPHDWNGRPLPSALCIWDYPGVGTRWVQTRWLEVVNATR